MAKMMQCPTCKKSISMEAPACPKCGQPITDEVREQAIARMQAQKKNAGVGCLVILIAMGLLIYFAGNSPETKVANKTPATQAAPAQEAPKPQRKADLGMTVDSFIAAFNTNANTPKKGTVKLVKLKDTEETSDKGSTVQAAIGKHSRMVFSSDKAAGNMTDLTLISGGEKLSALDTTEMMLTWITIVQTLSPGLAPEERGQVLKDTGLLQDKMKESGETVRGGVRYWHSMGKGMGIWFGAVAQ